MILSVTFSDGLAVSAIVLSIVTMGFEVAFFIVQTQQLYKSQKESADYIAQMREVLGKIEGMTTSTRDALQKQFNTVLEASLGRQGAIVSATMEDEIAQHVEEVEERLATVEANSTDAFDIRAEFRTELEQLRTDLSRIAHDLPNRAIDQNEATGLRKFWLVRAQSQVVVGSEVKVRTVNVTMGSRRISVTFRTPDGKGHVVSYAVGPRRTEELTFATQQVGPHRVEIIDLATREREDWLVVVSHKDAAYG